MVDGKKLIYHERQKLQFCLLHTLNNLFQLGFSEEVAIIIQEKDAFTRSDLNTISGKLDLGDPNRASWNPFSLVFKPHHNEVTGNYDVNVLIAALEGRGKTVIWHDKRNGPSVIDLDESSDKLFGIVLNVPMRKYGGLWRGRHWIALTRIRGVWYNSDSDLSAPHPFENTEKMRKLLDGFMSSDGEVFLVMNDEA